MRHWHDFAGLAKQYEKQPVHIAFGNPFRFNESVYPKVEATLTKVKLAERPANLTFHQQITHPTVARDGAEMTPGWNASNQEITARHRDGCYVLFDREGNLVFRGRATFEEVRSMIDELLRKR